MNAQEQLDMICYQPTCTGCMLKPCYPSPDSIICQMQLPFTWEQLTPSIFNSKHSWLHLHGTVQLGMGQSLLEIEVADYEYLKSHVLASNLLYQSNGHYYWILSQNAMCLSASLLKTLVGYRMVVAIPLGAPHLSSQAMMYPFTAPVDLRLVYNTVQPRMGQVNYMLENQAFHRASNGYFESIEIFRRITREAECKNYEEAQEADLRAQKAAKPSLLTRFCNLMKRKESDMRHVPSQWDRIFNDGFTPL